jgi:hypothetical protein
VQSKCNRPDARATPSGRGLVMGAFSTILERRLQLTIRTLGQAIRMPSGILIIMFYSNIGLGQNWGRWKADKKILSTDRPDGHYKRPDVTHPDGMICSSGRSCRKFQNYFPDEKNLARPDARVSNSILDSFFGFPKPINKRL